MADSGIPCAWAVAAITRASTNWLCAAAPDRISRGAMPRSYSWTPSVTRASISGVGLPSLSAGVPSTMMASKRVSEVLEAGASRRASTPHPKRPRINKITARIRRLRQPRRGRRRGVALVAGPAGGRLAGWARSGHACYLPAYTLTRKAGWAGLSQVCRLAPGR